MSSPLRRVLARVCACRARVCVMFYHLQADAPLVVPESEVGGSIGSGKGATPFKKVSAKKL